MRALSEELENPMNVHRWRKLEGSDPATYEMIQKIQTLQKRLIGKTEEVVEKDLLIQEKEKLYVELKNILARQPGPEVAEQLAVYQQNLREKQKQMKAMTTELAMYKAQVNEYKYDIERLGNEVDRLKHRWFRMMQGKRVGVSTAGGDSDGGYLHSAQGRGVSTAGTHLTSRTGTVDGGSALDARPGAFTAESGEAAFAEQGPPGSPGAALEEKGGDVGEGKLADVEPVPYEGKE